MHATIVALLDLLQAKDVGIEPLQKFSHRIQIDHRRKRIIIPPRLAVLHVECDDAKGHVGFLSQARLWTEECRTENIVQTFFFKRPT